MPLVVLCGYPCSGKSRIAEHIAAAIREGGGNVVTISEERMHLGRNACYKDGHSEKNTRGLLRSETDRNLTKSTVVIMDSLNFIKGYRYELWCLARSSGTRYCMVHVDTPTDSCVAWNAQRAGDKYSEEVMSDLLKRFERPDSRNRWDSPLFTVKPDHDEQHVVETVELVVSMILNKSGTSNTVKGILGSRHAKDLNPTVATTNTKLAGTNLLHEMDSATQNVLDSIIEAQSAAGPSGAVGLVRFGEDLPQLRLQRQVPLFELRRHKKAFLKLATNNTFSRLDNILSVRRVFIEYLKERL